MTWSNILEIYKDAETFGAKYIALKQAETFNANLEQSDIYIIIEMEHATPSTLLDFYEIEAISDCTYGNTFAEIENYFLN
jgi:hypothetical protein